MYKVQFLLVCQLHFKHSSVIFMKKSNIQSFKKTKVKTSKVYITNNIKLIKIKLVKNVCLTPESTFNELLYLPSVSI